MRLLHSICCRQIIIFSRIDNNPGESVNYPGHILVYQRTLHIDIPEENTIQSIIEHHV